MLPIYSRTPVATAQQAATIDEYSAGRMVLGLGVSHQVTVENWYGTKLERPLQAMREYVGDRARDASAARTRREGEIFTSRFRFMGYEPRAGPADLRRRAVAEDAARSPGEIADGVMLWLCNPDYIRDVVVPEVRAGPRAGRQGARRLRHRGRRAGRRDRRPAPPPTTTMRADLVTYWSLPFYRAMIERSGFGEDIAAFDAGMQAGDVERAKAAISDRFLDDADRDRLARGGPRRRRALRARRARPRPASAPVPRTDFEATLEAAAPRPLNCRLPSPTADRIAGCAARAYFEKSR